jgi:hypothetical protein
MYAKCLYIKRSLNLLIEFEPKKITEIKFLGAIENIIEKLVLGHELALDGTDF